MPKQHFTAMACGSKSHAMLWHMISMKLNIGEEITGLEIMKCIKSKWKLCEMFHLLHSLICICWAQLFLCVAHIDMLTSKYFIIQWISTNENSLKMKFQMNYLEKDNWADLRKCWHVINLPCKVLHVIARQQHNGSAMALE